ncbi:hypothetical protein F4780DRAFT_791621 [Xylariomycetidae sp. FL0641]|nr:hypothetical protein F4780DRAFT_791621 [Xylariomycetidae sp. FL0641]
MVTAAAVKAANATFASQPHAENRNRVCVFAGATAGIGYGTLRRLAGMLRGSTFYVVGRGARAVRAPARGAAGGGPDHLRVDAACAEIAQVADKVDYLCMSPGGMPFQGAVATSEGLELSFAVSYYSRLRLVWNLLPLLRRAPAPRLLSILNGTLLTTLAFDHLAATTTTTTLTFLHATTPGLVHTGTPRTTTYPPRDRGLLRWALLSLLRVVSGWVIVCFGADLDEAGERQAYNLTRQDGLAPGSWQVDRKNDVVPPNAALSSYRERGWAEKVWDHSATVWEKALSNAAS